MWRTKHGEWVTAPRCSEWVLEQIFSSTPVHNSNDVCELLGSVSLSVSHNEHIASCEPTSRKRLCFTIIWGWVIVSLRGWGRCLCFAFIVQRWNLAPAPVVGWIHKMIWRQDEDSHVAINLKNKTHIRICSYLGTRKISSHMFGIRNKSIHFCCSRCRYVFFNLSDGDWNLRSALFSQSMN